MQCIQWKENSSHFDENREGQYMHTTLYDLLIATTKCILYIFEFHRKMFSRYTMLLWLRGYFCYFPKTGADLNNR